MPGNLYGSHRQQQQATFRRFYEDYVHPVLGEEVFRHRHGQWEQDFGDSGPT
jgi:hypothetical protein